MKKISIIIPHYNSWEMLKELLDTIPLTDSLFETIIVDDKSDDFLIQSSLIKEKYPEIKIISNYKDKKGAGAARNCGLNLATGEWLLFADADDLFLPDFEKEIKKYLESNLDIVYYIPTSFTKDNKIESKRHESFERYILNYIDNKTIENEMKLRYYFQVPWSKLIKKKLVDNYNIQFDEVMYSNDTMFSAKVGHFADEIGVSKKNIYSVRQNNGSLTSIVNDKTYKSRLDIWLKLVNFIRDNNVNDSYKELNITMTPQIAHIIFNKLSFKNINYVIKKGKEHNIPILDTRIINLNFLFSKILKQFKKTKSEKIF